MFPILIIILLGSARLGYTMQSNYKTVTQQ